MRPSNSALYVDQMAEMVEQRVPVWRMAHRLGLSQQQVIYRLRATGLDPRVDQPLPPVPTEPVILQRKTGLLRKFTQAEDDQLLALDAQGLTLTEIARVMGRRPGSVRARLECLARRAAREEFQQGVWA